MNLVLASVLLNREDPKHLIYYRVLFADPVPTDYVLIDVAAADAMPFWNPADTIRSHLENKTWDIVYGQPEPWTWLVCVAEDKMTPNQKSRRDALWALIQPILALGREMFVPQRRCERTNEICAQRNILPIQVLRPLRRVWQGGCKNALLCSYARCGGPGKKRTVVTIDHENTTIGMPWRGRPKPVDDPNASGMIKTDKAVALVQKGARHLLYTSKKLDLVRAYEKVLGDYFRDGVEIKDGKLVPVLVRPDQRPSLAQFRNWAEEDPEVERRIRRRFGNRKFDLEIRPLDFKSTHLAWGPGSFFQIDATLADIILVGKISRLPVGRPIVYLVVDVFSGMIVGVFITLENMSYIGAALALENAASDKVAFCRRYGVTITKEEWPSDSLCSALVFDGGELSGPIADNIANNLDIRMDLLPPFRADMKGLIETHFQMANRALINWLPGVSKGRKRCQPNPAWDAMLDIDQFTEITIRWILRAIGRFNANYPLDCAAIEAGWEPIPRVLWEKGLETRSGYLQTKPLDTVRLNLLPSGTATPTRFGLGFKNLFFRASDPKVTRLLKIRASLRKTDPVPICYDPRFTDQIFFRPEGGASTLASWPLAPVSAQIFAGWSWADVHMHFKRLRKSGRQHSNASLTSRVQDHALVDAVLERGRVQTEAVRGRGKSAMRNTTGNIRENRKTELKELRNSSQPNSTVNSTESASDYVPPPVDFTAYE